MATKTNKYTVDGSPLFAPLSPFAVSLESLADPNTGRTDDGIMHIQFVRTKVRKFTYRCGSLTAEEMSYLEKLVQGKVYRFTFDEYGTKTTVSAYTSTIQYETVDIVTGRYDKVQFSIIEM